MVRKMDETIFTEQNENIQDVPETPEIRRLRVMVEIGEFEWANRLSREILWENPENGWAYFYALLAGLKISDEKELLRFSNFTQARYFLLAKRFADESLKAKLLFLEMQKQMLTEVKLQGAKISEQQYYTQQKEETVCLAKQRSEARLGLFRGYAEMAGKRKKDSELKRLFESRIAAEETLLLMISPTPEQSKSVEEESILALRKGYELAQKQEKSDSIKNMFAILGIIAFTAAVISTVLMVC